MWLCGHSVHSDLCSLPLKVSNKLLVYRIVFLRQGFLCVAVVGTGSVDPEPRDSPVSASRVLGSKVYFTVSGCLNS